MRQIICQSRVDSCVNSQLPLPVVMQSVHSLILPAEAAYESVERSETILSINAQHHEPCMVNVNDKVEEATWLKQQIWQSLLCVKHTLSLQDGSANHLHNTLTLLFDILLHARYKTMLLITSIISLNFVSLSLWIRARIGSFGMLCR